MLCYRLIAACVKYWWFGLCSKIESFAGGDWYSPFLSEVNYVFVVFNFTSKQTSYNLGRQYLSPERRAVVAPTFGYKHSEFWGDKRLSPVRQFCLPKIQNACF